MNITSLVRRARLPHFPARGLDLASFWRAAGEVVADVVPHYIGPCWFTFDPVSLLVTSHFQPDMPPLPAEWLAHEYFNDDFHKLADAARSVAGYSTIHEKTGGDPGRSEAWKRWVEPYGGDQELLIALRTQPAESWGLLGLYRQPGEDLFSEREIDFLRQISTDLALGARRGLLVGEAADPEGPESPGLLILREDWSVDSMAPGVER